MRKGEVAIKISFWFSLLLHDDW